MCAARVERRANVNGAVDVVKKTGRFVSTDPEVVNAYFWEPTMYRLSRQMITTRERLQLGAVRCPALAAQVAAQVQRAHDEIQLQLPLGDV